MKISVITVCLNNAQTIERTLLSVAGQNWSEVEHIVIDGASTDGTKEIIEGHRTRLAYFASKPDKGIYDAMNKGLAVATGDIIGFLNADDYYASDDLLSMVASQMRDCNLEALMGDVTFFHKQNPACTVRYFSSDQFRPDRLAWGWMPAHPALFLRKEVYGRVGLFKTDYRIAGDFEFIVRAFHGKPLRYGHSPNVFVRMQLGGISTSGWRAKVILNREMLRACHENGLQSNILMLLSRYPKKLLELLYS